MKAGPNFLDLLPNGFISGKEVEGAQKCTLLSVHLHIAYVCDKNE